MTAAHKKCSGAVIPHDCQSSVAVLALLVFRLIRTHVLVVFVVLHLTVLALFVLCFLLRTIFSCIIFRHKNFLRSKNIFLRRLIYLPALFFLKIPFLFVHAELIRKTMFNTRIFSHNHALLAYKNSC